ncbi:MAG TPA: hypothetical protein VIG64_00150 [Actinomycetota bacterium]|jgi:hypothetical protein
MMGRKSIVVWAVATALLAGACGGGGETDAGSRPSDDASGFNEPFTDVEAYPAVVSSELVVGSNRVQIALFDENDAPIGSPGIDMHVEFFDLDSSTTEPVSEADGRFVWSIPDERGLWEFNDVEFDSPGSWGARVSVQGKGLDEEGLDTAFEVLREGSSPAIGSAAPASDTPTAADAKDLSEITSDNDPTPRFYETSVADAIAEHEPFVVVFASPKYCTSQVCGPTLDVVEGVAEDWPGMTFIHVEVFDLSDPSKLEPVPAMAQWQLPSEPWVFVVDGEGKVASKYEGTVSPRSLDADLRAL